MTLRRKTLTIISLVLGVLFVLLYLTVSAIVTQGFADIEEQATRENVQRAQSAIDAEIMRLVSTAGDWAAWDETYTFVAGENPDYPALNLQDTALTTLELNLMLFASPGGEIVYSKAIDLQTGVALPASVEDYIEDYFTRHAGLLQFSDPERVITGFVLLPESPLLIAARPILTSESKGPIHGALVVGRYLDAGKVEELAQRTQNVLALYRLDDPELSPEAQTALAALPETEAIYTQPLSQELIAGYTVLNDVFGQPQLLLRVELPRRIFAESQVSLRYLLISLLVLALVFIVLTLLLLERLVLARLAQLSAGVARIGAGGDLAMRLSLPGTDELAGLATSINEMLNALQESLKREQHLKREVHELRIEIDEIKRRKQVEEIVESDFFQKLQDKAREMRQRRSGEGVESDEVS